jgi:O-antigen/teichoic acid export membrane protein
VPLDLSQQTARREANGRGGLRGVGSSLARNAWALADQGLLSASNFVTLVLLARGLTPASFGAFVLAYTGLLLVNGFQSALVTGPHNVIGQAHLKRDYRSYTTSTAAFQTGFVLVVASLALLGAAVVATSDRGAAAILLATVPALVAWQAQEFARRVLYTESRFRAAFVTDLVSYGGQVVVFAALVAAGAATPVVALLVVAATSAAGAVVGGWAIRASLGGAVKRAAIVENWVFGRWLGATVATSWLALQVYIYLAAIVVDSTASGALKAAQVVLGPLNAFYLFLGTVLPIRLAARRDATGDAGLDAALRRAAAITAGPSLVYCILAAVFAEPILTGLYGSDYGSYANVVRILALYYAMMLAVYLLSTALTARRQTRSLFAGSLVAAAFGVGAGWAFVERWGVEGAAFGMLAGALILCAAYARAYRRPVPATSAALTPDPLV